MRCVIIDRSPPKNITFILVCIPPQVSQIPFPRRQIFFPQTEAVAFRRRRQLEIYLRRLLVVCSKLPASPIYEDEAMAPHGGGLTRASLVELSAFFRKGVCECGGRGDPTRA